MKSKNKQFSGYYPQAPKQEGKIKIPKVYKVNGYYIIGEHNASIFKELGMKVEEIE